MILFNLTLFVLLLHLFEQTTAAPSSSLVVNSGRSYKESGKEGSANNVFTTIPKIYYMHVQSEVSNRYAHTTIISKVKNLGNNAQEATFSVILPESAFISGFIMEVNGNNYTAFVEEKEQAKKTYGAAVAGGLGAAHVAVSVRDSNCFTVSVNVEPQSKAAFYLIYEELLERKNGLYEQVINLHPGQPVNNLTVEVVISESRKITALKVPPIRSGNEIGNDNFELDPRANLEIFNDTRAVVQFTPNLERQKQLAHLLGTNENYGLAGQFVVQYDVERDPKGGEVLVKDGYFVHFFAPSDLKPLPKHVIFVLDTSSSMADQKIHQLKEAMYKIFEQLYSSDLFSLVEFNTDVKVWNLEDFEASTHYPKVDNSGFVFQGETNVPLSDYQFPVAYPVNGDNIKRAKNAISNLKANGGTNIFDGLKVALHLVEQEMKRSEESSKHRPIIIFLTDGQPTIGEVSSKGIVDKLTKYNSDLRKSPIFTLSFGEGADKKFLQELALLNSGFSRHIYEAADAALQLQDFYTQIASPLLTNVTFEYESSSSVIEVTESAFPLYFDSWELIVCGRCSETEDVCFDFLETSTVFATNVNGTMSYESTIKQTTSSIERLWAYLTIKQLLQKKEVSYKDRQESEAKALDLALKYSFVTSVSSLVVVKPNATYTVDDETGWFDEGSLANGVLVNRISSPKDVAESSFPEDIYENSYTNEDFGLIGFRIDFDANHSTNNVVLLNRLPWLISILKDNETLNLPSGNYKLGLELEETLLNQQNCSKTPFDSKGNCTLLNSCPQVHYLLTSVDVYMQYFCIVRDEYAGICCSHI